MALSYAIFLERRQHRSQVPVLMFNVVPGWSLGRMPEACGNIRMAQNVVMTSLDRRKYTRDQRRNTQKPTGEYNMNYSIFIYLCSVLAVPVLLGLSSMSAAAQDAGQTYQLPALPYALNALEPYISEKTMSFHYGKHHQTYVDNLNKLVAGTPWAGQPLETIIKESAGADDKAAIFNNAAQTWNHSFFWKNMKPGGGGTPTGRLLEMINKSFGSVDEFKKAFSAAALAQFGSGWVWLVQEGDTLKVVKTSNADNPVAHGQTTLLACDVWEHAYYLDYQNKRKDYVEAFLEHLVNWEFAGSQLK
jgi:superoxide dismutase, Fe-Mn family